MKRASGRVFCLWDKNSMQRAIFLTDGVRVNHLVSKVNGVCFE